MKVIIAGSRTFQDYPMLCKYCDWLLKEYKDIEIVSGGSKGADSLAEVYAKERNYKLTTFLPNWNENGKSAGPLRNLEMAKYSEMLIAFWDGESKGTKNMVDTAKRLGLNTYLIIY